MTKEEKIQETWIIQIGKERFKSLKSELVLDGWLHYSPADLKDKELKLIDGIIFYRPKSLQGIENNNGWIKIENEADLPKEEGNYFVFTNGNIETCLRLLGIDNNDFWWLKNVTHYQPIQKPKPPIY